MISPLAYIHPEAKIGENVEIAPFVFIDKNVVIGDNNKIMANVNILYGARIGNGNTIFPGAVIGAIPQDLKFRGEESTAEIGDNNIIRENVTAGRTILESGHGFHPGIERTSAADKKPGENHFDCGAQTLLSDGAGRSHCLSGRWRNSKDFHAG